jgi:hypothetical protein
MKGVEPRPLSDPADRFRFVHGWHVKTTRTLK